MIDTQTKGASLKPMNEQEFGQAWIKAITDGALDRLQELSHPKVLGRLLLPAGLTTVHGAAELVAEYRAWFGSCSDFKLEASRVEHVGQRLGVFYRLHLLDQGFPERIEQQLYFWFKDGRVQELHLLCSGFQSAVPASESTPAEAASAVSEEIKPDAELELVSEAPDTASTCAILTPMIRSKLLELQSGQVLQVRVNDPHARGDVEAWSRLTGNPLLKIVAEDEQTLRFYVQKK